MDAQLQMESMEQHLLFHKALAEDEESFEKINDYLAILRNGNSGERLSDSVDESIRAVFSLVLEKGMDPWAIDLEEFARMYSEKVSSDSFDMLVAGRLLLMAWKILHLQSDETRMSADTPIEEEMYIEGDFDTIEEDQNLIEVPEVKLDVAINRKEMRPVTMLDLLDAFKDATEEAKEMEAREAIRAAAVEANKKKPVPKFDNKAHKEDDEAVVERAYQRIFALGMDPMPITEFYTASKEENISFFVSVLHLVRDGKLEVSQETLPYGEIMVQVKLPEVTIPVETVSAVD